MVADLKPGEGVCVLPKWHHARSLDSINGLTEARRGILGDMKPGGVKKLRTALAGRSTNCDRQR